MIPIRIIMVVAKPGARGDFVAGWLGTLPNAVDTQWRVDPETGRSFGTMNKFKDLTNPNTPNFRSSTLQSLLAQSDYVLDPDSPWMLAMSCHGSNNLAHKVQDTVGSLQIVHIITDPVHDQTIGWEFVVKTHFCRERFESSYAHRKFYNTADAEDQQRCAKIKQMCKFLKHNPDCDLQGLPCVNIDYAQITQAGGSRYLTQQLGISASEKHHLLWDNNVVLAASNKSYQVFGHTWTEQNYLD